ncbi:hypothetical protein J3Q64DRAFT_1693317 [Phycomyces blakesleeanus]|uniref:Uncharacterized protein n=2 Tax=Phycomyces blakesleeanus TaxID=4837 RepID=A0A167K598_PHYB8|nr:hypothetical protein PHYBLDRAFT_174351 [Phycomyces blakesleeanus NRRL 1555(-)]OAD67309.1 hypothetical protein PHYBLDRAFT_174351 [Phycomyces blakesleeanus NRRL 1555(-)]|eukprot:XP_018285349.1 hypothetical protein PHYBLDRAFT_174351 [Phycomyces blakesleeanus NRRL 1555(-)]
MAIPISQNSKSVQRAREEMVNTLVKSGRKYNTKKTQKEIEENGRKKKDVSRRKIKAMEKGIGDQKIKKKFNRDPSKLTATFKGYHAVVVGALYRSLKNRQKGKDLLVVNVGEFRPFQSSLAKVARWCRCNSIGNVSVRGRALFVFSSIGIHWVLGVIACTGTGAGTDHYILAGAWCIIDVDVNVTNESFIEAKDGDKKKKSCLCII